MTGKALICKLGTPEPIEGADKIVQVKMFGETVIVSKDTEEGQMGLLFDCETQLSHEFASANNLYRHSNLNADKTKTGYLEDNRRIKPIRLKGVRCSAMWMPIKSLANVLPTDEVWAIDRFKQGEEISSIDEIPICSKYIPPKTKQAGANLGKSGRVRQDLAPTFKEHFDTDQWGRNSHKVQEGDLVIITEKLHGTSFRCGLLPVVQPKLNWWQNLVSTISSFLQYGTWYWGEVDLFKYKFVVGSRRVVKSIGGEEAENKDHFYNVDLWTDICTREFKDKLRKGETIYGEIVGFTPDGQPIMGSHNNSKLQKFMSKDEYKDFINRYGETTEFSYGCNQLPSTGDKVAKIESGKPFKSGLKVNTVKGIMKHPELGIDAFIFEEDDSYVECRRCTKVDRNKVFVYRITMTNEDGETIDLSWEQVKARCEQLGVAHVPELDKRLIKCDQHVLDVIAVVQHYTESDSKNFPQHINEGVCVRIENGLLTPQVYKSKRFLFKVLEGIIKDNPDNIDIEESN